MLYSKYDGNVKVAFAVGIFGDNFVLLWLVFFSQCSKSSSRSAEN